MFIVVGDFEKFCNLLKTRLDAVVDKWKVITLKKDCSSSSNTVSDTKIYPLIQMGPAGVDTEDKVVSSLFGGKFLSDKCKMAVASGYFNLTSSYMDLILNQSQLNVNILMASPQAWTFLSLCLYMM